MITNSLVHLYLQYNLQQHYQTSIISNTTSMSITYQKTCRFVAVTLVLKYQARQKSSIRQIAISESLRQLGTPGGTSGCTVPIPAPSTAMPNGDDHIHNIIYFRNRRDVHQDFYNDRASKCQPNCQCPRYALISSTIWNDLLCNLAKVC